MTYSVAMERGPHMGWPARRAIHGPRAGAPEAFPQREIIETMTVGGVLVLDRAPRDHQRAAPCAR